MKNESLIWINVNLLNYIQTFNNIVFGEDDRSL